MYNVSMPPETKPSNNLEIEQALKEFEMKTGGDQAPTGQTPENIDTDVPKMVRLVMKLSGGAIKEQKTAEYVLLGFVVIAISISLFLLFSDKNISEEISPELLQQMESMPVNDPSVN